MAEPGSGAMESALLPLGQGTTALATRQKLSRHQTLFAMAELDPLLFSCDLQRNKTQFTDHPAVSAGKTLPLAGAQLLL